jgi:hypothetical protein
MAGPGIQAALCLQQRDGNHQVLLDESEHCQAIADGSLG